ncbi:MAG: hypothetical protein MJ051_04990 [Akkermansia sp.]|nr:hypothetical protein [Akkermansia sp.]
MSLRFTIPALLALAAVPVLGEPLPQGDDTIIESEDGTSINPDAPNTPDAVPTQGQQQETATPSDIPAAETVADGTETPAEPTPVPAPAPAADTPAPVPAAETPAEPTPEIPAPSEAHAPQVAEPPVPRTAEEAAQDAQRLRAAAEPLPAPQPAGDTILLPEADDHVLSQSGLFSVSGGDSLRMGAIATHADDVYHRLLRLLDLPQEHRFLISIRLVGHSTDAARANPIRTRIRIIDRQPSFQIRIYPGGGIDLTRLDGAIITMVLYEHALRELDPAAYPDTVSLPDWLVTGIVQTMLWRSGQADRAVYKGLYERAEMLPPESIIGVENPDELDAASRQVYDVSCGVLMMSLLSREGGTEQLKTLLAEAATAEGTPQEIIGAHFHELGLDKNLLNKWWALQLADLSLPRAEDALTPLESERQLVEALTIIWYDPETETPRPLHLDNVYELLEHEDWRTLVQPNIERLVRLSAFCFPEYRPIVTEYCRVLADLMNGTDPDEVQNSLGPLQELRQAYVTAAIRGRDYLDWYEITHLGQENRRSFDTYLEAMRMLRREDKSADTPVSRYLDDIEALYKQGADAPLPDTLMLQLPARHGKKKK